MAIVTKVRRKKHGQLVEFTDPDGRLRRVVVPPDAVSDEGEVDDEVLGMGIPYGLPWERIIGDLSAEAVADALRRAGIWTLDDLRHDRQAAVVALQHAIGAYVSQLTQAASSYDGGQNGNSN
jgi:hypothetical protein